MKSLILFILGFCIIYSCSPEQLKKEDIDYIKIIITGHAKKATAYNKGLGASYYSYFDLNKDSAIYMYPGLSPNDEDFEYSNFAYKGQLDNVSYEDTLLQLVQALSWRPVGIVDTIPEDVMYCGWNYYIEFKVGEQIKYYEALAGVNDTIDRAYEFFIRLEHYPWRKHSINSNIIDLDKEVVSSYKRFGTYDKRKTPYLFPECGSGIDFQKLVGTWRVVGDNYRETSTDRFYCYTLNADRTFAIRRYVKGEFQQVFSGTYFVTESERKIVFKNTKGDKMIISVSQLTDSCLSGMQKSVASGKEYEVKYNRF